MNTGSLGGGVWQKNTRNTKKYRMDEKSIRVVPFVGEKGKWRMWPGKIMARYGTKWYGVLLTGDRKILVNDSGKTKYEGVTELKLLNNKYYNELILSQKDTVCFQVIEEVRTKCIKYENTIQLWIKSSGKFEATTGNSKTRPRGKFSKWELYEVTGNPKEWITDMELLIGDLKNLTYKLTTWSL